MNVTSKQSKQNYYFSGLIFLKFQSVTETTEAHVQILHTILSLDYVSLYFIK
jgi:hypothetical protein